MQENWLEDSLWGRCWLYNALFGVGSTIVTILHEDLIVHFWSGKVGKKCWSSRIIYINTICHWVEDRIILIFAKISKTWS